MAATKPKIVSFADDYAPGVVLYDADGTALALASGLKVQGAAADGAAVAGNPVLVGGQDGTNAQTLLVDTSGRQLVVGAAADGATAAGNPVQVGGVDGSGNAQALLVGTNGRVQTEMYGSTNAAISSGAVGGSDGQSTGLISLSTQGYPYWFNGANWDRARTPNVFKTINNQAVTAATGITVWDPASGKKVRLMGYSLSLSVAGRILLYTGATTALTTLVAITPDLLAATPFPAPLLGNGILAATADHNLNLDVSANGSVSGMVWGVEE
jgi:hypothetical protein